MSGVEPMSSDTRSKLSAGMSREPRAPAVEVQADDHVAQPPRAGALRQRRQVDVGLGVRVMAGDEPGQHAGIGRQRVGADQRQRRPPAPAARRSGAGPRRGCGRRRRGARGRSCATAGGRVGACGRVRHIRVVGAVPGRGGSKQRKGHGGDGVSGEPRALAARRGTGPAMRARGWIPRRRRPCYTPGLRAAADPRRHVPLLCFGRRFRVVRLPSRRP